MRGTLYRRKPESCPTWTHIWKTLHKIHITTCCPILIFLYFTVLLYLHMLHFYLTCRSWHYGFQFTCQSGKYRSKSTCPNWFFTCPKLIWKLAHEWQRKKSAVASHNISWIALNLSCRYILFHEKNSKRCCDITTPESIHTKDESKRGSAFALIFGVNWPVQWM